MFNTLQALGVALLALLPGAAYTYAFEREAGSFGAGASDRLIRFLSASAIFQAAFSGLTYFVYVHSIRSGDLQKGTVDAWVVELAALGYIGIPIAVGWLIGHAKNEGWRWARLFVGPAPEPRAWDHLWARKPVGVARIRTDHGYVAGFFGKRKSDGQTSYAAGYPESGDIFFTRTVAVDATTGEFIPDEDGNYRYTDGGFLIRWDEIRYLELFEL